MSMRNTTRAPRKAADPHGGAGRRFAPRVPVQTDCTVHAGELALDGVLLDISTGGAAVELLADATVGAGENVVLEIPTVLSVASAAATVVSLDEEVFGTFVLRLKFDDIADELRTLIEQRAAAFRERQAAIFLGRV